MVSTLNANASWNHKNLHQQTVRSPLPSASLPKTEEYAAIARNTSENLTTSATQSGKLNSETFTAFALSNKVGNAQNAATIFIESATNKAQSDASQKATTTLGTSKGQMDVNLDEHFSGKPGPRYFNLEDVPILLPNADNIVALTEHASARFKDMLKEYGIPDAPAQITFGYDGKMLLPTDYAYTDELMQAFEKTPGLESEMSTINALTSHYVGMQKSASFGEEYARATTQIAADAILDKYAHLFQDNGNYSYIALTFSDEGDLAVTANGNPVKLA